MANLMNPPDTTSTRPYLIRALYEWCTDNGLTPYVAVAVDETVQVPREYVKNNEIVLNISFDATSSLKLSNDFIEFKARFAGSSREIMVPIDRVIAIYARENGQGMSFPMGLNVPEAQTDLQALSAPPFSVVGPEKVKEVVAVEAQAEPERSKDNKVVQLVPVDGASGNGLHVVDNEPEPPEPSKPSNSRRPALKRVK